MRASEMHQIMKGRRGVARDRVTMLARHDPKVRFELICTPEFDSSVAKSLIFVSCIQRLCGFQGVFSQTHVVARLHR